MHWPRNPFLNDRGRYNRNGWSTCKSIQGALCPRDVRRNLTEKGDRSCRRRGRRSWWTPFSEKLLIAFHAQPSISNWREARRRKRGKRSGIRRIERREGTRRDEKRESLRGESQRWEASGSGVTAEREGYPVSILMLHPQRPSNAGIVSANKIVFRGVESGTWKGNRDKCLKSANASNAQPLHFTSLRCTYERDWRVKYVKYTRVLVSAVKCGCPRNLVVDAVTRFGHFVTKDSSKDPEILHSAICKNIFRVNLQSRPEVSSHLFFF